MKAQLLPDPLQSPIIISRVTGGEISTIDGLLRSGIAGANLFLLNPAGVLFGPNASLDISGSLHVSTADYLVLDDMQKFMATPLQGELLSTAAPASFGFLDGSSLGQIQLQGAKLILIDEHELSLTASSIELDSASIEAEQGKVTLVSVGGTGEVVLTDKQASTVSTFANIALRSSTIITSTEGDGNAGNISINSSIIELSDGGRIESSTYDAGAAGSIAVTTDRLLINGDGSDVLTGIVSIAESGSSGNAGDLSINAQSIELLNGGEISAKTFGRGDAGSIAVVADRLFINRIGSDRATGIFSSAEKASIDGNGGRISIDAQSLELRNGGEIGAVTFGTGDAGRIEVRAGQLLIDHDGLSNGVPVFSPVLKKNQRAGAASYLSTRNRWNCAMAVRLAPLLSVPAMPVELRFEPANC